jgi:DNA-binding MarR family transcriptional regulator
VTLTKQVLIYVRKNPGTTRKRIIDDLGVRRTTLETILYRLREAGLLEPVIPGKTKGRAWPKGSLKTED